MVSEAVSAGERVYGGKSASERTSDRVDRLLHAALELFGTQGYSATSIEQLCAQSNVSTRSFYKEIGSRPALLKLLVTKLNHGGESAAAASLDASAARPVAERVAGGIRAYLGATCRDRRTARVCYVEVVGASTEIELWRQNQRENIVEMFETLGRAAAERGEIAPHNYRLLTLAVIGAANIFAQEWALSTPTDGEQDNSFAIFVDELTLLTDAVLRNR